MKHTLKSRRCDIGYRSEIYIKMDKQLVTEFEWILKVNYFEIQDEDEDSNYAKYYANELKWYSGYPEVEAINNFISNNDQNAALLAISEDSEIDTFGSPYDVDLTYYKDVTVEW